MAFAIPKYQSVNAKQEEETRVEANDGSHHANPINVFDSV